MSKGSGDIVGFRTIVWAWTTLFVFIYALALWNRDVAWLGSFEKATAVFLTLFGIYLCVY